jgi:hypothetical protein
MARYLFGRIVALGSSVRLVMAGGLFVNPRRGRSRLCGTSVGIGVTNGPPKRAVSRSESGGDDRIRTGE